jgi:hypothetical protein
LEKIANTITVIGRQFKGSVLDPDLNIGETAACFYLAGIIFLLNRSTLLSVACVAGGIRGHERMGSLKYRLPKNDTF